MKNNKIKEGKLEQTKKLALMLSLGGLTGGVAIAALAGLFKPENAASLAFGFMSGPNAVITAILLDGNFKERVFSAVIAGVIATFIVVFAAGFGPKLLGFLNLEILKIAGAISVFFIALLIAGIKIPTKIPLIVVIIGVFVASIWR